MRIGIIGASSQVGSSLAFYLKHFANIDVVCYLRSTYAKIFFDKLGLITVNIDLEDEADLRKKFQDLDAIIDCSYPGGQLFEIPRKIKWNLSKTVAAMQPKTAFIYMSSIMAYGMPPNERNIKNYLLPRSSYARIKRMAEKKVRNLCAGKNIRHYNFRLGQVHGFLQSVNASFREKFFERSEITVPGMGEEQVNIIFINSIANAVMKAAKNEIKPGLYTLVAEPQWTLRELYSYYADYYKSRIEIKFDSPINHANRKNGIKSVPFGIVARYRPLLETYLLMDAPALSIKMKGKYRKAAVANEINSESHESANAEFNLVGMAKINKIPGLHSGYDDVMKIEKESEALYERLLNSSK